MLWGGGEGIRGKIDLRRYSSSLTFWHAACNIIGDSEFDRLNGRLVAHERASKAIA